MPLRLTPARENAPPRTKSTAPQRARGWWHVPAFSAHPPIHRRLVAGRCHARAMRSGAVILRRCQVSGARGTSAPTRSVTFRRASPAPSCLPPTATPACASATAFSISSAAPSWVRGTANDRPHQHPRPHRRDQPSARLRGEACRDGARAREDARRQRDRVEGRRRGVRAGRAASRSSSTETSSSGTGSSLAPISIQKRGSKSERLATCSYWRGYQCNKPMRRYRPALTDKVRRQARRSFGGKPRRLAGCKRTAAVRCMTASCSRTPVLERPKSQEAIAHPPRRNPSRAACQRHGTQRVSAIQNRPVPRRGRSPSCVVRAPSRGGSPSRVVRAASRVGYCPSLTRGPGGVGTELG